VAQPLERTPYGDFRLRLGRRERAFLRMLPSALEQRLGEEHEDPELRRLFPPGYADDQDANAEYGRLVGEALLTERRAALRTFAETLDRDRVTAEELDVWARALNDLRLVLGTRLDVREEELAEPIDPRDPRAEELALYAYLSWLQEHVVDALSG
jgi:Domain of unknown function (DUF2017)